ncbi:MAG: antibiotic biosynthesis monooxygenase [Desulfobacterales bacterium]|jgi:heme-degrading monooxygenase HmoA|nr:antibiotic biosynthesis monooxygenase [Desulfobacterales bacterium]
MPVQVIIKRKFQVHNPAELIPLLTELRDRAKVQPGYISGQTLKNLDKPQEYMVISTWEKVDDWNKWVSSSERRDIQGRVDSLIGERTFYEVFEPVSH